MYFLIIPLSSSVVTISFVFLYKDTGIILVSSLHKRKPSSYTHVEWLPPLPSEPIIASSMFIGVLLEGMATYGDDRAIGWYEWDFDVSAARIYICSLQKFRWWGRFWGLRSCIDTVCSVLDGSNADSSMYLGVMKWLFLWSSYDLMQNCFCIKLWSYYFIILVISFILQF